MFYVLEIANNIQEKKEVWKDRKNGFSAYFKIISLFTSIWIEELDLFLLNWLEKIKWPSRLKSLLNLKVNQSLP